MSGRFEQRRAFVTGAAGGIGAACLAQLRAEGAWVAGLDRVEVEGADLALTGDMASDRDIAAAAAQCGSVDLVVHAAAASVNAGTEATASRTWLDIYDVNVVGAVRLIRAFAPGMRARGAGCFTMLSSINARFATPTLAAYATSKAALDGLIRTAALELAPDKIRVVGVAPASVETALLARNFASAPDPAEARARNAARHPLGRFGTVEDISNAVLFASSDQAGWITGTIIEVDGGAGVTRR